MKLYAKMSVLFNFLTVGLLLSLGIIAEYVIEASHKFIKEQFPDMVLTFEKIYQRYTQPQQLAI